jgi:hypothetical protein
MKVRFGIRYGGDPDRARDGVKAALLSRHASLVEETGEGIEFRRGSRRRRLLSSAVESWPARILVKVLPVSDAEGWISLEYEVATGWHLTGATDLLILEAEAATIEAELRGVDVGIARTAADRLRRVLNTAIGLNASLAAFVVIVVGVAAGFPLPLVVGCALVVAGLDALVIAAFADVIADVVRRMPRVAQRLDPGSS